MKADGQTEPFTAFTAKLNQEESKGGLSHQLSAQKYTESEAMVDNEN